MKSQMQAAIFNDYLKSEDDDWSICLENSFAVLRKSWQSEWVGLPYLLGRCVDFLNLSTNLSKILRRKLKRSFSFEYVIQSYTFIIVS